MGRDVTHRVDEILQIKEPDMHTTNSADDDEVEAMPPGLELLSVDEKADSEYMPPAFFRHLVDHEVTGEEHRTYSLAALSERLTRSSSRTAI